ncbi:MAG: 23S rRNA (adenine(2030)-N(6))-methyltransferase RlmJ [Telluria sp.]
MQIQLHEYMNQKDTAYTYIDTHSGAGVYALDSGYATKNAEYDTGIGPLWERKDLPKSLAAYVNLVKGMNPSGKMRYYPGSPYCADRMMREQDRLRLFELHPADSKLLADNFRKVEEHAAQQGERPSGRGKRVLIERGDGFQGIKTLLPPPSRRALVLIDPPYEDKQDYRKVRDMLADSLARFPSGVFAVWYPVLQRMESRQFADKLKRLAAKDWLSVTLTVTTPGPDGFGPLHSSGMFILNPPYTLEPTLREVMPYLVKTLGKDAGATFTIESGAQVTGTATTRLGANGTVRMPVGNARRASPTSGTGSLRLPGQAPAGTPGTAGAAPRTSSRPGADTGAGPRGTGARTSSRPGADAPPGPRGAGARTSSRPVAGSAPVGRIGTRTTSAPRNPAATGRPGGKGPRKP